LLCSVLDDGGEIATTTVFHQYVQNSSVSVNISIVIAYDAVMMKVLKDVAEVSSVFSRPTKQACAHFCYNLFSVPLTHPFKVKLLSHDYLS
jgi:hypothetical protein